MRDVLVEFLSPRSLLLVLDNLEQIRPEIDAGRQIADLIAACPSLRVVATSRSPLKIRAEREYPVPPLPVPSVHHAPLESTRGEPGDAIVRRAGPGSEALLHPHGGQRPSRRRAMPPAGRTAPRHRARRGTHPGAGAWATWRGGWATGWISWRGRWPTVPIGNRRCGRRSTGATTCSGTEEQMLFRRLSVFAGGCTLEAAEAIAAGADVDPVDVLDGITALVEQSLLRADRRARDDALPDAGDATRLRAGAIGAHG